MAKWQHPFSKKLVIGQCLTLIALSCSALSCKSARFEITHPKKGQDDGPAGGPTELLRLPPAPPVAGLQVVKEGIIVTRLPIGSDALLEPTKETHDGDDANSPCLNAGIVKASYKADDKDAGTVTRPKGCETLSQPYKFATAGTIRLQMQVTTDEGETAIAVTTMEIYDPNAPHHGDDDQGGNFK